MAARAAAVSGSVILTDPLGRDRDYSGVVVWLEPLEEKTNPKPTRAPTILHKNKTFVPHVLAVEVGTKVAFPNRDPFFHNAFSNYDGQIFDIGLHAPGTTREVTFRRPGVVRVFCNIHPTMSAVVVVVDTPYFAVSDASGKFSVPEVPPGEYELRVFHERVAADALKALERRLTVSEAPATIAPMSLSAAGYVERPHKNKVGKDYPAVIRDQYPGQAQ